MTAHGARVPDFYVVGAPKAGTTAMYEYLRAHPDLYLPERKELRYFGSDLEIRDRVPLSREEYLAYFAGAPAGALVGTAYVWYLFSTAAAAEIAAFSPRARIIAMLRNPLDMLPALHGEHLANGNEDIADFTAALDAEPARRAGRRIPAHAHLPQGLRYLDVPRYAEQLERYFAAFGRDRVHVIVFDDFAADTAAAYRDTLRFLGVSDAFRPDIFETINASRRIRSEWLRHFLARPPRPLRLAFRYVVPARLRRGAYERAKNLNVVAARRQPVPQATAQRLRDAFRPEAAKLSQLLGRDFVALWMR
ncbi:MAG TPA: sulfotransferase domain-containing protein [Candidatus Limnocylindria bacterium]